jgi:hypothetical protein
VLLNTLPYLRTEALSLDLPHRKRCANIRALAKLHPAAREVGKRPDATKVVLRIAHELSRRSHLRANAKRAKAEPAMQASSQAVAGATGAHGLAGWGERTGRVPSRACGVEPQAGRRVTGQVNSAKREGPEIKGGIAAAGKRLPRNPLWTKLQILHRSALSATTGDLDELRGEGDFYTDFGSGCASLRNMPAPHRNSRTPAPCPGQHHQKSQGSRTAMR